jgi:hypothetical protein
VCITLVTGDQWHHGGPMNIRCKNFRSALAATGLLAICGCTTLHPVNIAQNRAAVETGDTVVVTTDDGQVHTFKVVDITEGGIHGRELSVPFSDIRLLQVKRVDVKKTVLLTIGVIGVGAIAADDGGGGGGGGY